MAKYWASYGGSRIGHAGLHVHGGISIDLDYPMHRYFLWSKQLEFMLGPGNQHLATLGGVPRRRTGRQLIPSPTPSGEPPASISPLSSWVL